MTFALIEPAMTDEADHEHETATAPTPTARVIANSHIRIAIGDLMNAYKLIDKAESFDGLAAVKQAQEHLSHSVQNLNGTVWQV